jgi:proteasome accessory factor A
MRYIPEASYPSLALASQHPEAQMIRGVEMEFGYLAHDNQGQPMRKLGNIITMCRPLVTNCLGEFTEGGFRVYPDGAHPEVSTPEVLSAEDLVYWELAGERLMFETLTAAKEKLTYHGLPLIKDFELHKDVNDGTHVNHWGYHENFCIPRDVKVNYSQLVMGFASFLATRSVWAAAGGHIEGEYTVAQKMFAIGSLEKGSSVVWPRPLLNIDREEPLADPERWRRLHIICGDPNMSPYITLLKNGASVAVLKLIQSGIDIKDLFLKDPVAVAHIVAADTSGQQLIELQDGSLTTATAHQRRLIEKALEYQNQIQLTEEEIRICKELVANMDKLSKSTDYLEDTNGVEVEWQIRHQPLAAVMQKKNLRMRDDAIRRIFQLWDNLDPEVGMGLQFRRKGIFNFNVDDDTVEYCMRNAPLNTRARLRGQAVLTAAYAHKAHAYSINLASVSWDYAKVPYTVHKGTSAYRRWADPHVSHSPAFETELTSIRANSDVVAEARHVDLVKRQLIAIEAGEPLPDGPITVELDAGDICGDRNCLDADDLALRFTLEQAGGKTFDEVIAIGRAKFWEQERLALEQ